MDHPPFAITDDITSQLAQLLGRDIDHLYLEARREAIPATVYFLSLVDRDQRRARLVLKAQENQSTLLLYTHYLRPCDLNSPRYYGYITVDGQLLLVMDYVHQAPGCIVGTVYNFCSLHRSLVGKGGQRQTPAMAAGITDHRWTVDELASSVHSAATLATATATRSPLTCAPGLDRSLVPAPPFSIAQGFSKVVI